MLYSAALRPVVKWGKCLRTFQSPVKIRRPDIHRRSALHPIHSQRDAGGFFSTRLSRGFKTGLPARYCGKPENQNGGADGPCIQSPGNGVRMPASFRRQEVFMQDK